MNSPLKAKSYNSLVCLRISCLDNFIETLLRPRPEKILSNQVLNDKKHFNASLQFYYNKIKHYK